MKDNTRQFRYPRMVAWTMGDWTFRVVGEALPLTQDERRELTAEILRLRKLMGLPPATSPERLFVRLEQNPSGLPGEYASLLMEATVRGLVDAEILPTGVRQQYRERPWFAVSLEVLAGFSDALAAARAEE